MMAVLQPMAATQKVRVSEQACGHGGRGVSCGQGCCIVGLVYRKKAPNDSWRPSPPATLSVQRLRTQRIKKGGAKRPLI
jgi:hypothetical protein